MPKFSDEFTFGVQMELLLPFKQHVRGTLLEWLMMNLQWLWNGEAHK